MPRLSRIDAPGALHHIIVRGNARRKIFLDDPDRDRFLDRLGSILQATGTGCCAWSLMPNHFHLFLKTGTLPLSGVMRRLLTSYAVTYNKRHRRWGHLFQNRYKSILCQEEPYLLELTRYIHLNPLRARLVADLKSLDRYPYAGHSVLMGHREREWQDTDAVLRRFGERVGDARRRYRDFVAKGIQQGRRPELTGGGLVRSAGGWSAVKALRKQKSPVKGDERMLGDSAFVERTLEAAHEHLERRYRIRAQGYDVEAIAERVGGLLDMAVEDVLAPGKNRRTVRARSLLCYWAVRECGMAMADLSRRLGISATAVGQSVHRGEKVASENRFRLMPD